MGGTSSSSRRETQDVDHVEGSRRRGLSKRFSFRKKRHSVKKRFSKHKYEDELRELTKAIEKSPSKKLYRDRATTLMLLKKFPDSLDDVREAMKLDGKSVSIPTRLLEARCYLAQEDVEAALASYQAVGSSDKQTESVKKELEVGKFLCKRQGEGQCHFKQGEFSSAAQCYDECFKRAKPSADFQAILTEWLVKRAEALVLDGQWEDAKAIANELSSGYHGHGAVEAMYIRGYLQCYQGNLNDAINVLDEVLEILPGYQRVADTHGRARRLFEAKRSGDTEFEEGNFEEAITAFTEALAVDANHTIINSTLYCSRGVSHRKCGRTKEAIDDLTKSLELDVKCMRALICRSHCFIDKGDHSEAQKDYDSICGLDPSRDHKYHDKLENGKKDKGYHKLLDCPKCYRIRIKRKQVMQEIMDSEATYGENLKILKEEFYEPLKAKALMKPENLEKIFLNLDELILVNTVIRNSLKFAKESARHDPDEDFSSVNIGALFLESTSTLKTFEKYIVSQTDASVLLERKIQNKEALKTFLKDSQANPRVQRQPLQSFLIVPFQRIMKYPLLLDRLYSDTPDYHEDKDNIKEAKEKIEW